MKYLAIWYLLLVLCVNFFSNLAYAQWKPVGPSHWDRAPSWIKSSSSAIDTNDIMYYSYVTNFENYKNFVVIKKNENRKWITVAELDSERTTQVKMAFNKKDNLPYIVFLDSFNSNKLTVLKYNINKWDTVGKVGFSPPDPLQSSLTFDTSGNPVVAFEDTHNQGSVSVMTCRSNVWTYIGAPNFSLVGVSNISISIDNKDSIYVACINSSKSLPEVYKFSNNFWWEVGNLSTFTNSYKLSFELDNFSLPHLAIINLYGIVIESIFINNAWQIESNSIDINNYNNKSIKLGFDSLNMPLLLCNTLNKGIGIVYKLNLNKWELYGDTIKNSLDICDLNIIKTKKGKIFFAYDELNGQAWSFFTAVSFENGKWKRNDFGGLLNDVPANVSSTAVDNLGNYYVLLTTVEKKMRLLKFKNQIAEEIALPNFYLGKYSVAYLTLDKSGGLTIAYTDFDNGLSSSISAMKLINRNWVPIGQPKFAEIAQIGYGDPHNHLIFNDNDEPYFISRDSSGLGKVKRFINNNWEDFDSGPFNVDPIQGYSMVFDSLDHPFIFYDNLSKLNIIHFDGIRWSHSEIGFPLVNTYYGQIVKSRSGDIYVTFFDDSANLRMMKYKDSKWVPISNNPVSSIAVSDDYSIAFDDNNLPIISFIGAGDFRVRVNKFDGTNWTEVGSEKITRPEAGTPFLNVINNRLFLAYHDAFPYLLSYDLPSTTLPLNFISINSSLQNKTVNINWAVNEVSDCKKFVIQRSDNGFRFDDIDSITTSHSLNYFYNDKQPLSNWNYYRVKEISKQNSTGYSSVTKIKLNQNAMDLIIYPNPIIGNGINYKIINGQEGNYHFLLINSIGAKVFEKTENYMSGNNHLITGKLPAGIYDLQMESPSGNTIIKRIMIRN